MATIGSGHERLDLVFSGTVRETLVATLVADGIQASLVVNPPYSDYGFGDLVEYFTDLERSWRGWDGHRSWTSLEGDLSITAHHTGSHVVLRVELVHPSFHGGSEWSARVDLTLGAGEDLSSAAAGIRDLLGG